MLPEPCLFPKVHQHHLVIDWVQDGATGG